MSSRHNGQVINCANCGTGFYVPKCRLTGGRKAPSRYCSRRCMTIARGGAVDPVEGFWARVDKNSPGGCWIWKGAVQKFGHGALQRKIDGKTKFILAHRYAWMLLRGPIPDGMHLCHTCDVPACVNPDHLYIGTDKTNADDKCKRGRWNGQVKLTPDQVRAIRGEFVRYNARKSNMGELAEKYGVARGAIYAIVRGAAWTHVK